MTRRSTPNAAAVLAATLCLTATVAVHLASAADVGYCPAIKIDAQSEMRHATSAGARILVPCPGGSSQGALELICCGPSAAGYWDGAGDVCDTTHYNRWMQPAQDTCVSPLVTALEAQVNRPSTLGGVKNTRVQQVHAGLEELLQLLNTKTLRLGQRDMPAVVRIALAAVQLQHRQQRVHPQRQASVEKQQQRLARIFAVLQHIVQSRIKTARNFSQQDLARTLELLAGIHTFLPTLPSRLTTPALLFDATRTVLTTTVGPAPISCNDLDSATFHITWSQQQQQQDANADGDNTLAGDITATTAPATGDDSDREGNKTSNDDDGEDEDVQTGTPPPAPRLTARVKAASADVCVHAAALLAASSSGSARTTTMLAPTVTMLQEAWSLLPASSAGVGVTPTVSVAFAADKAVLDGDVTVALPIIAGRRFKYAATQRFCPHQRGTQEDEAVLAASLVLSESTLSATIECSPTQATVPHPRYRSLGADEVAMTQVDVHVNMECRQLTQDGWTTRGCTTQPLSSMHEITCACAPARSSTPMVIAAFVTTPTVEGTQPNSDPTASPTVIATAAHEPTLVDESTGGDTSSSSSSISGDAGNESSKAGPNATRWSFVHITVIVLCSMTLLASALALYSTLWVCAKNRIDQFTGSTLHYVAGFIGFHVTHMIGLVRDPTDDDALCYSLSAALSCFCLSTILWTVPLISTTACKHVAPTVQGNRASSSSSSSIVQLLHAVLNWTVPIMLVVATALFDTQALVASASTCWFSFTPTSSLMVAVGGALAVLAQAVVTVKAMFSSQCRTADTLAVIGVGACTTLSAVLLALFATLEHSAFLVAFASVSFVNACIVLLFCCLRNREMAAQLNDAPLLKHFVSAASVPLYQMRLQKPSADSLKSPFNLGKTGSGYNIMTPRLARQQIGMDVCPTPCFDPAMRYTTPAAWRVEQVLDGDISGGYKATPSPFTTPRPSVRAMCTQPGSASRSRSPKFISSRASSTPTIERDNPFNTPQCSPEHDQMTHTSFFNHDDSSRC
ncbi:hypothetical protein PTSG_12330 [Salpingoeca rosetta]|uniref:GPS domain-containing protein n=1 Tax=Salpingoeca rosetta (strain ATCC 50818 / BSB-021) TaxID=946362 RepID=F2UBF3_SALR5|nr:uncharacterized protein PTSG_12330 [Salpingoeca rosetta]EGD73819.1 hypothetical protein PTSG_12330 [Salpingoeca rosetta]|eukprot:XP_004993382.1 hypothetical protein PTSG_12330 [Salpingoeca rosetta]